MILARAVAAAALLTTTSASPYPHQLSREQAAALVIRAFAANEPNGYTPTIGDCPSDAPSIRVAGGLSPNETAWLQARRNATLEPMRDLLSRANISGFDATTYINNHQNNATALPNIGIAVSGGGYRAMLNGAGYIEAFDNRTANSTSKGQLGGLLQSATYLSGLSGGSWLVGSLYSNNFTSIASILAQDTPSDSSGDLWQLGNSIFEGPRTSGIQLFSSVGYYSALVDQVNGKSDAGFNTTITDYWGRALSYQLINATDGGPGYTFSSIQDQDWFTSGTSPLPLIVTDVRSPGDQIVSGNSTIMEISPWELGSPDPTLYGYAPLRYVGTNFTAGSPSTSSCTTGFDSASFVMGTSSSLFNAALTTIEGSNFTTGNSSDSTSLFSSALTDAITAILQNLDQDEVDIASWVNPFYGYRNGTNRDSATRQLTLVDGGEDGANIPLQPLLLPERHVDVIFAVDSSADTNTSYPTNASSANWPDGISMVSTYERSLSDIANGTAFPAVPDINTFMNQGLNSRPTFFGCDAANISGTAPLVVYLPNAPYVYNSNTSTYDMEYNDTQRNAMILNAYNGATQGNGTLDADWPACVACAILNRSFNRTNTQQPSTCTSCFNRYCWNGTTDSRQPGNYVPTYKLANDVVKITSGAGRFTGSTVLAVLAALIAGLAIL